MSATSSDSTRLPIQLYSTRLPPVPDPAAQAGGPPNLDEFVNGPLWNAGGSTDDVDEGGS